MVVHIDYTKGLRVFYHGSLFFNKAYVTRRERALRDAGWTKLAQLGALRWGGFEVERAERIGRRISERTILELGNMQAGLWYE